MLNELMGLNIELKTWMIQAFLIVLGTLLITFAQGKVMATIKHRVTRTENPWDDALFAAMTRPLTLLIWVVGLSLAADLIRLKTAAPVFEVVQPMREIGVIYCIVWFLFRFIKNVELNLIARHEQGDDNVADRTTIEAIAKLVRLSFVITAILITLQTLGFSISGVLAFGGVGGIAVGFAARDLLANFFGGLTIYLDRPFSVGDWIRSPDRNIEGTVENIGWRVSCIRTFDKRPLYIPNSVFTSIIVENASRMSHRRINEVIGIRYDDLKSLPSIVNAVKRMLIEHVGIDDKQTLIVNFDNFGESTLDFFVYTFTKTTNWIEFHTVKEDVLLKIAGIVEKHNAEIAYPTQTIHVESK